MMQIVRSCKRFSEHFVFLKLQLMSLQKDRRYKFLWDTCTCLLFSIAFCLWAAFFLQLTNARIKLENFLADLAEMIYNRGVIIIFALNFHNKHFHNLKSIQKALKSNSV